MAKLSVDEALKIYFQNDAHYADLLNAGLFGGGDYFKADQFAPGNTEVNAMVEQEGKKLGFTRLRDLTRLYRTGNEQTLCVVCAAENQMEVHYAMPLRIMLSCAIDYWQQWKTYSVKHDQEQKAAREAVKEGSKAEGPYKTSAEFLSGLKPTDYLMPVVVLVVYYGSKPWDGPLSISETFHPEIPEQIRSVAADFRIHLLEISSYAGKFEDTDNAALFGAAKVMQDKSVPRAEQVLTAYKILQNATPTVRKTYEAVYGGRAIFRKLREGGSAMQQIENTGLMMDRIITDLSDTKKQLDDTAKQLDDTAKQLDDTAKQLDDTTKQLSAEHDRRKSAEQRAESAEQHIAHLQKLLEAYDIDPDSPVPAT